MCRSRGTHVACTRAYSGQGARKKIRPHMCTYGRGLERLLVHMYGQGSCTWLGRNGETASSSCSWGGNGMCRVHGEATECVVFIGRQRNVWEPTGWLGTECVCRRSGNGGPQTCLPAACDVAQVGAQRGPSSSAQSSRP